MESLITDFVQFFLAIAITYTFNFEISLKFPHFLQSYNLSCSTTHSATFGDNNPLVVKT